MDEDAFVKRWTKSLELGTAAVFIGAGLSRRAGYPDWRSLLRDIAHELGLDIELEHDLAAIAQYSLNRAVGKRHKLTQLIVDHFPPKAPAPEPFHILARLPLRHLWTTNYDKLAETAWQIEGRALDVKSRNDDLGPDKPWAHAILYKMHGTVDHPAEVVIAKDDYELYRRTRRGFLQLLTGHLIGKQFLFLGFSFTDPNLAHLFANIREAFKENGPEHYAIVRRPKKEKGPKAKERFELAAARHRLWVEDLQRYGIQCVEVDDYEDVDELLRRVEQTLALQSVLVSGSFPARSDGSDGAARRFVEDVARDVGRVVAENGKRLISGFGLTVGSACISGALGVVLKQQTPSLDQSFLLRPFPQEAPPGFDLAEFRGRYRSAMIRQAGICVFVGGIREDGQGPAVKRVIAPGVIEEFEIARKLNRIIIPIGATGGAAAEIWKRISRDFPGATAAITRTDFDRLNDTSLSSSALADVVGRIIKAADSTAKAGSHTRKSKRTKGRGS